MRSALCLLLAVAFTFLMIGCGRQQEPQQGPKVQKSEPPAKEAKEPAPQPAAETAPAKEPVHPMFVLRIDCGAVEDFTDPDGNVWKADHEFVEGGWGHVGGGIIVRDTIKKIDNTNLQKLYLSECFRLSAYRVTCPNGTYTVTLHFAETYRDKPGDRVFDVSIEGKRVLAAFDVVKEAGKPLTAVVKSFPDVQVADGELTIEFTELTELPMINAIEVVQTK